MVIILIRRCVRVDKESEFLASYNRNKPAHADFIDECLTKVNDSSDLPTAMRSLPIGGENCVTYLNVARWKSAAAFAEAFSPQTMQDPAFEVSDRLRIVLDVV